MFRNCLKPQDPHFPPCQKTSLNMSINCRSKTIPNSIFMALNPTFAMSSHVIPRPVSGVLEPRINNIVAIGAGKRPGTVFQPARWNPLQPQTSRRTHSRRSMPRTKRPRTAARARWALVFTDRPWCLVGVFRRIPKIHLQSIILQFMSMNSGRSYLVSIIFNNK